MLRTIVRPRVQLWAAATPPVPPDTPRISLDEPFAGESAPVINRNADTEIRELYCVPNANFAPGRNLGHVEIWLGDKPQTRLRIYELMCAYDSLAKPPPRLVGLGAPLVVPRGQCGHLVVRGTGTAPLEFIFYAAWTQRMGY